MDRETHTVAGVTLDVRSGLVFSGTAEGQFGDVVPGLRMAGGRRPRAHMLNVGPACGLRCAYCNGMAARENAIPAMTAEVVDCAFARNPPRSIVTLAGSGEPLAYPELVEHVVRAVEPHRRHGAFISCFTNGLALSERWARHPGIDQYAISLDGPRETHNALRGDTYDRVMRAVGRLQEAGKRFSLVATLTTRDVNWAGILEHLCQIAGAVQVVLAIVVLPTGSQLNDPDKLLAGTRSLASAYERLIVAGRWDVLRRVRDAHVLRLLRAFIGRHRRAYRCSPGEESYCFDGAGRVYACPPMTNLVHTSIATVETDVSDETWAEYASRHVDNMPGCRECWVRYQCGGPCGYRAYVETGDERAYSESTCRLLRGIGDIVLETIGRLHQTAPDRLMEYRDRVRGSR